MLQKQSKFHVSKHFIHVFNLFHWYFYTYINGILITIAPSVNSLPNTLINPKLNPIIALNYISYIHAIHLLLLFYCCYSWIYLCCRIYWVLQWIDNWRQWFLHPLISSNEYFIMENNSPFWIHNLHEDCWLNLVWTRSQPSTVLLPLFQVKFAYFSFHSYSQSWKSSLKYHING